MARPKSMLQIETILTLIVILQNHPSMNGIKMPLYVIMLSSARLSLYPLLCLDYTQSFQYIKIRSHYDIGNCSMSFSIDLREKRRERRERAKRKRERESASVIGCLPYTLTRDQTHNLSMCPHSELNLLHFSMGWCSNQRSHTGQCQLLFLKLPKFMKKISPKL